MRPGDGESVLRLRSLRHALDARPNPILGAAGGGGRYITDDEHVAVDIVRSEIVRRGGGQLLALRAGFRERICFDPCSLAAAVVTSGGISPGLNDIVEFLVQRCGAGGAGRRRRAALVRARAAALTRHSSSSNHLLSAALAAPSWRRTAAGWRRTASLARTCSA